MKRPQKKGVRMMDKVNIKIKPDFVEKSEAAIDSHSNKVKIEFPLLRTAPTINANGDTYDYAATKEKFDTVNFGYINLEHRGWINVGAITSSEFEEGNIGRIKCEAVLWKSVLDEFDISVDAIKNGDYKISMEVYFNDYYVLHGDEKIERPEAEEYVDRRGSIVDGKKVARVIIPSEYSGAALTENAADKTLDIEKVIASKLENDEEFKQKRESAKDKKDEDLENNKDTEEATNNMFKEFETDEEFNTFLEEQKKEFEAEYAEKVVANLEDEDVEGIEDVIKKYKEVQKEYAEYKEAVAQEKKLNERKADLLEMDIGLETLEASEEDILEMSDKSFELMLKGFAQASKKAEEKEDEEEKEQKEEASNKEGFDPTDIDLDKEDEMSDKDMIRLL